MDTVTSSEVEVCIRAQRDLIGGGRLELADELIAPDCVDHGMEIGIPRDNGGQPAARGPEAIKGVSRWLRAAFPDLSYEIEDAFGAGDRVALRCTVRGTHQGEFLGHRPTGRSFAAQQIHLFRLEDGRIAEHWAGRDDVGMLHQLGVMG
jgi:ketosteroid isomerase-like protein